MRRRGTVAVAMASVSLVAGGLFTPSVASAETAESNVDAIVEVQDATASTEADVLENVEPAIADDGEFVATTDFGRVSLPSAANGPAIVEMGANTIEVRFPGSGRGELNELGVVEYDNGGDASTLPVAKNDGGVQFTTVISSEDAPTRFEYDLGVGDATVEILDSGLVVIEDTSGGLVGGIAPPWAYDANGEPVPTHFELTGTVVTQVVDHAGAAYPVVADPYLNGNLFNKITVDTYKNYPRVNLTPSTWGLLVRVNHGTDILSRYGWTEALNWNTKVRNALTGKLSMKQQFECHVLGGILDVAGRWEWNLERQRPTLTVSWTTNVTTHRCNWNTAKAQI